MRVIIELGINVVRFGLLFTGFGYRRFCCCCCFGIWVRIIAVWLAATSYSHHRPTFFAVTGFPNSVEKWVGTSAGYLKPQTVNNKDLHCHSEMICSLSTKQSEQLDLRCSITKHIYIQSSMFCSCLSLFHQITQVKYATSQHHEQTIVECW